jgi:fatty acid desaturase
MKHNRKKLAFNAVFGELSYLSVCTIGLFFRPEATFVVFVLPYLLARFLMMWGNWGQHAFIHQDHPENPLLNSLTCINTRYNRRCFNDGYHIGHHVKANRHWTDLPIDLERNAAQYDKEGAVVFEGIDFFQVSLYLFLKRYDWLAKAFVETGDQKRTEEEIIAFLKTRLRPIIRERAPALAQAA